MVAGVITPIFLTFLARPLDVGVIFYDAEQEVRRVYDFIVDGWMVYVGSRRHDEISRLGRVGVEWWLDCDGVQFPPRVVGWLGFTGRATRERKGVLCLRL